MTAPVTGPYVSYVSPAYSDSFRRWYRQRAPYDSALDYRMYEYYGIGRSTWWNNDTGTSGSSTAKSANYSPSSHSDYSRQLAHASNRAYEGIKGALGASAGWAENIAQIGKTRQLIVNRSVQMARFVGALRKARFVEAARILKTPVPSRVSTRKAISQNFLEYEYGVKPLISDIEGSLKLLTSDPPAQKIKGSGRGSMQSHSFSTSYSSHTKTWSRQQQGAFVVVTMRARVMVTNPNLFLANQLGLIDLALPWKLIPFSFVVDWFVNVEQVLSSVSDWYGVTLLDPHTTTFAKGAQSESNYTESTYSVPAGEGSSFSAHRTGVEMQRSTGISGPTLIVKPFEGFSVRRGAQAIALVLATLGK